MFVGGANETFSGFGGFGKYPQGEKRSEKMVLRSPCRNWMRREACHRQNQCGGKSRDCGGGRTSKCSVNTINTIEYTVIECESVAKKHAKSQKQISDAR